MQITLVKKKEEKMKNSSPSTRPTFVFERVDVFCVIICFISIHTERGTSVDVMISQNIDYRVFSIHNSTYMSFFESHIHPPVTHRYISFQNKVNYPHKQRLD